ncbi:MAG: prepilin peptidase [Pseudomonadota bacterium]|nr:MAG: prepilin peptidase [Pseudomonadota bacterium]
MALLEILRDSLVLWLFVVALLGLLVGSFLNVVIHRLPVMLKRQWRRDCVEYLGEAGEIDLAKHATAGEAPYNLVAPRSACPHCGHKITALENIPVLSYLILRGRCSECRAKISIRYPLVESLCALLVVAVAWRFGVTVEAGAAMLLTWALLSLSLIDYDHQYLPDQITLPFLWLGLFLNLDGMFAPDLASAVIGAAVGYLILWSVYQIFKRLTGKEGMGFGDFKLLAMLGAWLGWQALPAIILLSSLVGAVIGISLIALRRHERSVPIPFGPYLAIAGWIMLVWGDEINAAYLRWVGMGT